MPGGEMRFAEQHKNRGAGMALANLGDLGGSVPVSRPDFPQVFARHAVEAIYAFGMIAGGSQQFVERSPVITPVEIEADALPKFALVNFAPPPLVENVLVAREDGFNAQHHRTPAGQRALLYYRRRIALGRRQSVVIADQHHVGSLHCILKLWRVEKRVVGAEGVAIFAKVFAPVVRVL